MHNSNNWVFGKTELAESNLDIYLKTKSDV